MEFEWSHLPEAKKEEREGRMVHAVGLTARGKKPIGNVLPRHAKVVKAPMRALDALRFLNEMRFEDADDED